MHEDSRPHTMSDGRPGWTVLACAAVALAALLVARRYVVTHGVSEGEVHQLDRFTGNLTALAPRPERGSAAPAGVQRSEPLRRQDLRGDIVRLARERSSFHATCTPVIRGLRDSFVVQGWHVYAVKGNRLLPWDQASTDDLLSGKYLVSYTYVVYDNDLAADTLGWYWEVFLNERMVRQVSGNPLLEWTYGLTPEARGGPAQVAAEQAMKPGTQEYVASRQGKAYHLPDCRWVADIPLEGLLHLSTVQETQAAGLRPCRTCKPGSRP